MSALPPSGRMTRLNRVSVSRRHLMQAIAGGAIALSSACRNGGAHDTTSTPRQNSPTVPPSTPSTSSTATTAPRTPEATAAPSATPEVTPRPMAQILYRGGFSANPSSHDFNANLACGGDPSLWSGLLTMNTDLAPFADWAESWQPNQDASQWTFHLRRDNHGWSNGEPVTAADFVWSWQRLLIPVTNAPHAWLLYDILNAEQVHRGELPPEQLGIRAIDPWTLEVTLVGPRIYFPAIVATVGTAPAYRPAVDNFGNDWTKAEHCVSNGPFRLSEWVEGNHWTTVRNERHWSAAKVRLEKTVVPITPADKHLQPYFTSQVDFMPVPSDDLANVRTIIDRNGELIASIDPAIWFLVVAPSLPPFDNLQARQAAAHAIDRKRLVQLSEGRASEAQSFLPPAFPSQVIDDDLRTLQSYDVDQALQLLAQTPYANGANWPPVMLLIDDPSAVAQLLAHDCAQQLFENIGLTVEVKNVSTDEFTAAYAAQSAHLYWKRWNYTYADPNNGYSDAFFPIGSATSLLPNPPPTLGELVGRGKVEFNPKSRTDIYRQCEVTLQSTVSYIPVAYPVTYYLIRPWVAGFPLAADSTLLQPGTLFTRLTSLVNLQDPSGT